MSKIVIVNDEKGHFTLQDVMLSEVKVLERGGFGFACKVVMSHVGLSVLLKSTGEMSELQKDGFEANMHCLGNLRHCNVLTPLAYYKALANYLISAYISNGSLFSVLHGDRHAELNWATRLRIVKGIARGLEFLHTELASYDLPHGNLKSSNVLLDENYEPLLCDYAYHMLINPNKVPHAMFAYRSPEYIEHQQVSPKSDIYCLGIIILEILTGKLPSQYLTSDNNHIGIDIVERVSAAISNNMEAEIIDPEISNNTNELHHMVDLLRIGVDCSQTNPKQRPQIKEVIKKVEKIVRHGKIMSKM